MRMLDNVNEIVRDDLKTVLKKGSRVSIAAACFSIDITRTGKGMRG